MPEKCGSMATALFAGFEKLLSFIHWRQGVVLKNVGSFCYFSDLSEIKNKYAIETDGIEFWSEDNLVCK